MKTNLENYEERFVDYMEGQLIAEEMQEVEAFVAEHPELEEDFKLFCSTKLEPDTSVVFTKKESLMQTGTMIRPLFVKIVAAAACVALLIGIGVHFLKPHQELEKQPMLASLTPIEAQLIDTKEETQGLRKSDARPVSIPRTRPVSIPRTRLVEETSPIELIAAIDPIKTVAIITPAPTLELDERLASVGPFVTEEPEAVNLKNYLLGGLAQTTKTLYKLTAKTVMDVYYTTDYKINEAKDQMMASR